MNDPYEEDDGYDDDYYDYDNAHNHKWYFSFDVNSNNPLSKWIKDVIEGMVDPYQIPNISGFPVIKFPVNSWNPNTANPKKLQYLGSNYHGETIWKSKYFVVEPLDNEYKNHLQSHAGYFVQQPKYYKGMFDILN